MSAPTFQRTSRRQLVLLLFALAACLWLGHVRAAPASTAVSSSSVDVAIGDAEAATSEREKDDEDEDEDEEDGDDSDDDSDEDLEDEEDPLTPIPTAAVGSSTFALVDSVTCDDDTISTIESVCSVNRAMFDMCVAESGYRIFPYSGVVPTATDISGLVGSLPCLGFITAVVLLDLPACTVAQMPLRAVCETLLKISVDMAEGEAAPSAEDFHEQMVWRRDSDLAKQAGQPYDNESAIYGYFMHNLRIALTQSNVTVLNNLTIIVETPEGEAIDMADGAKPAFDMSADDSDAGTVETPDEDDETDSKVTSEATEMENAIASSGSGTEVSALTSGAQPSRTVLSLSVGVAAIVAVMM